MPAKWRPAGLDVDEQVALLEQGAVEVVTGSGLKEKLLLSRQERRPLRIKLGCDPTAPDIHLGHTVVLRKLRQFQELGHTVMFIIGDFTATIGDPSGRTVTRPVLSDEQVAANAETYRRQVGRVLDPYRTEILFNKDWLGRLHFAEVVRLAGTYTVARMLERDEFEKRHREGTAISIHEFLYPLAQAYDSVHTRTDVELGGTDQMFNLIMARDVQREYGQEPQVALLMPLLEGTDGRDKMSKSLGNYIGIEEPPGEMFGKVMSIPDGLLGRYFELCTDVPRGEVRDLLDGMAQGRVNPRDAKVRLGWEIVTLYHGAGAARRAEEEFNRVFSRGELPEDMTEVALPDRWLAAGEAGLVDLLEHCGLVRSRSEARRLIGQGAVSIDGERLTDLSAPVRVAAGSVVRVGKRRFARLTC